MSVEKQETTGLVIDNGSGTTKAGFAGDDAPRSVFPTQIGRPKMPGIMVGLEEREIYAGEEVNAKRGVLSIDQPIVRRQIVDWEAMEMLWNHTLYNELKIPPEDHAILLSEAPKNTKQNRERTTQIMFEFFNVPCLYLTNQAVLALCASGHTTGLVIDAGEGATDVVPINEGYAISHATEEMLLAGSDLTLFLQQLLKKKGYEDLSGADSLETIQNLKDKICQVAIDYDTALKEISEMHGYEKKEILPDGKEVKIESEIYKVGESLFQPSIAGKEFQGIHKYANESIKKCDEQIKESLYMNILLSGGSTLFPNMGERIKKEIKEEAKKNVAYIAPPERKYSTWIGGSIISSLTSFQTMWMKTAEYEEYGANIVNRKCF